MKFGLMSYAYTTNLGNEIQSIAARRFLPKIDYFIDHEKLNLFQNEEKVKMIMNGWYLDCLESWPPSDSIDPLLISMHFNSSVNDTIEVISSSKSKDFFSSYGPVGCRDYSTLNLLNNLEIDAYYSGCLTLTLEGKNENKNNFKYIVVNSYNSEEIINFLKTKTDLPIYDIQQESIWSHDVKYLERMPIKYSLNSLYTPEEKFFIAENILNIYENAYCVITDRVHCTFPCLAFKTPVLFIDSASFGRERFEDIGKLVLMSSFEDYKENYDIFDINNPPKNSDDYLKIRKSLINKTKNFTGHINKGYNYYSEDEIKLKQTLLWSKTALSSRRYMNEVTKLSNHYEYKIGIVEKNMAIRDNQNKDIISKKNDRINQQKNKINQQKNKISKKDIKISNQQKLIDELLNSTSWKLTKPLRSFRNILKK